VASLRPRAAALEKVARASSREISTKSGKDRRVPIPSILLDHLDEHLLDLVWTDGLVFGVTADRPFNDTSMRERTRKASTYVGHAGIQITLDLYGHLMPGNESEAAAQLDAYLDRAGSRAAGGAAHAMRAPVGAA
jgi:integrase